MENIRSGSAGMHSGGGSLDVVETPGEKARRQLRIVVEQEINRLRWLLAATSDFTVGAERISVVHEDIRAQIVELRAMEGFLARRDAWQRNTESEQELREQMRRRQP